MKNRKPGNCCWCCEKIEVGKGTLLHVGEGDELLGIGPMGATGWMVECVDRQTCQQNKKDRQSLRERLQKEKAEKAAKEREEEIAMYEKGVKEFETYMGSPEYRDRADGEGQISGQYVHTINGYGGQYNSYSLLPDGHVFLHQHVNSDWWNNLTTVSPIALEAQEFFLEKQAQQQTEREVERQEREKQKADRNEKIRVGLSDMLARTTWEELEILMKKNKMKTFCPRELAKNGKPLYGS